MANQFHHNRRSLFDNRLRHSRARMGGQLGSKPVKPALPELHTTLDNVDSQLDCIFFSDKAVNGKSIPTEIVDMIFEYALTDDENPENPYHADTHYTRPDHTCQRKTDISLLMTCKRIYKETYMLPLKMKVHTFFRQSPGRFPRGTIQDPVVYFSELPPSQLVFLKNFHLFVQQFWLERDFFSLCQRDTMKNVVHLKLTIRRSDWWEWEQDIAPAINPYKPFPGGFHRSNDAKVMKQMWEEEEQDPSLKREFEPKYWGSAFQHLPHLKTLTMEFETEKNFEKEMDAIAQHAKKWKFPMGGNRVLSADKYPIKKLEWEGPLCMRSESQERAADEALASSMRGQVESMQRQLETGVLEQRRDIDGRPVLIAVDSGSTLPSFDFDAAVTKPVLIVRTVRWENVTT